MEYLGIVPVGAELEVRSSGFAEDMEDKRRELSHISLYSYEDALSLLNDMNNGKHHPDALTIVTYKGHEVLSIMAVDVDSTGDEVIEIAFNLCKDFHIEE